MIRVGVRLHDVNTTVDKSFQTMEERAKTARERGFRCVHLALSKNGYSMDPAALTDELAAHVRKTFGDEKLDIAVLGCYLNLLHPDEAELSKIKAKYRAHMRLARLMGADMVGTETGCPNPGYKFTPDNAKPETLEAFIRAAAEITEMAEAENAVFAIEPVTKHSVCNADRALAVLRAVKSDHLKIIFDPVNLLSFENYENRDYVLRDAMDKLCDHIAMVHIKDFTVENGDLKACAAGTGLMDYAPILRFLRENKPCINATLENTNDHNAVRSREFIERLYEEA